MTEKKTLALLKESVAESLFCDIFTFGLLAAMFYINQTWLDASIPDWILGVLLLMAIMAKGANRKRTFHDAGAAHEFIDEFYGVGPSDTRTPEAKE